MSTSSPTKPTPWIVFAIATLLSAFLVFQIQPVISKCVLPWFGGTPAVWTTCLLFFQMLLFAGYLYAHCLRHFCTPIFQGVIHLSLLIAAAWSLPIQPGDAWKPVGTEDPTWTLLVLLAAHVALPYFVLSSTGPLVQAWLSYENNDESVYRLYALSNAGSLAALLSYPFLVEPWLSVGQQSLVWSLAFCAFVLVDGWIAVGLFRRYRSRLDSISDVGTLSGGDFQSAITETSTESRRHDKEASSIDGEPERSTTAQWIAWVALPAFASMMLLVITSHVCQDIAVIPFLWVVPLSLYLLTFIISFDSPNWYRPKMIATMTGVAFAMIGLAEFVPASIRMPVEAVSYLIILFGVCLLCHGETARCKPPARQLTLYYALISLGGAIGGLTIAILCPMLFNDYSELPIALLVSIGIVALSFLSARSWLATACDWRSTQTMACGVSVLILVVSGLTLTTRRADTVAQHRNFFGVLRVEKDDRRVQLVHGNTIHGVQLLGDRSATPTSYYGTQSGVGKVIQRMQSEQPSMRIGVVGLGCGVLAAYGRPSDAFDLFEINSAVVEIAESHFSFLNTCPSSIEHFLGDGRLLLEREADQKYDLLVLDAFSSDAIPAHLLTIEAMQLYRSKLKTDGVLAIHLSNNHLDLVPLTHRLSRMIELDSREIHSVGDEATCTRSARWVIASDRGDSFWAHRSLADAKIPNEKQLNRAPLWTDQHHNLASVLNWSL
ncbi:spermidine synthase [Neorhodopirellula pilleata]|uniref:Spermidine synthase n=1 Tax=Neorhodopirellula pilleata TaxID=2714738 RepID=A0A5C5ZNX4_9BACT|nr:fused MFS/spermidine synthase [Neorhodopirellula pilleata]TWT89202.1 spermidine synthase [Neorhodopirellula pilleata]